ncbi:tetratricopeptide repeat protein 28-like [Porites lutea]|uniref:tetratricopeptide repeat protein 28-like n=1 Tax=Porites lutea TaxID=51062 RepID=UPI003CC59841
MPKRIHWWLMSPEIGDKHGEATSYTILGSVFAKVGKWAKAEEYFKTAIQISKEIGDIKLQLTIHVQLSYCSLALTGNAYEALSNLRASIEKCERILNFLPNKDRYKILFFDEHASPYRLFSSLCCASGKHYEALHVVELGRAKALVDLVSDRYFVEKEVSLNPESFAGILKVIRDSGNRTCLYISYHGEHIFLWIVKKSIAFQKTKLCKSYVSKHGGISVDDLFKRESLLRNFHLLPQEQCEDRSLFSSYANQLTNEANLEDSLSSLRPLLDEEEVITDPEPPTLFQVYNMLIAPVSDLLEGSEEIIVVPDRCFFQVPFAALHDKCNRYLSDTFKIRIVPSLTTLKLILDSPAGSHSETGALIVGEPSVTDVYFKGELRKLCKLPGAKAEAEMIARLLPESHLLIGEQATKQAVLQGIPSVSLVHFAAHGDAERGEIALTPSDSTKGIPHEQDYLLSMADISQVRLTAKLVVLSCCHTARGQIKTEGVVGIARAFLGSGARSVLVALWALQDDATEQFMRRFYENLVQGESASECLHRAMKWMRNNGFSEVRQWAPFMLIGDDVSFHFGKEK